MENNEKGVRESRTLGCDGVVTGCSGAIAGGILGPVIVFIAVAKVPNGGETGPLTFLFLLVAAWLVGTTLGALCGKIVGAAISRRVKNKTPN